MSILDIYTFPAERLRKPTKPIENINGQLQTLIDDMAETMYHAPGVGLAATQVGHDMSMIVYDIEAHEASRNLHVLINPTIIEQEGNMISENEGCLSVPDLRANVQRAEKVLVEGVDRDGNPKRIEANGIHAVILQHEIDHLKGILFIDHISALKRELYVRKIKKQLKKNES